MKPAPFDYVRATSVDEAVAALTASDGEAKLLAGGQSLVPMLNFRLVDAPVFVDINGIDGLAGIEETDGGGWQRGDENQGTGHRRGVSFVREKEGRSSD